MAGDAYFPVMRLPSIASGCTAALVVSALPLRAQPQARPAVIFPAPGTPTRRLILDAVRSELRTTSQFKVAHHATYLRRVATHQRALSIPIALCPDDLSASVRP